MNPTRYFPLAGRLKNGMMTGSLLQVAATREAAFA